MKFGKNLAHLSIPEWKPYNLDYNELKATIRLVTHANNANLKPLQNQFLENFNIINLFITTKYGEIARKIKHYETSFEQTLEAADPDNVKGLKLDIIVSNLIDLSMVLKKLSKFILIQKIAIKKVFKKFLKHYPNKAASTHLVYRLKLYLSNAPDSFVNVNLLPITIKLTNVISRLKSEKRKLMKKDVGKIDFEHFNNFSVGDFPLSNSTKFDLNILLKKNFALDFLLPDDINNLNEVLLNLNIYLNLTMVENAESSVLDVLNATGDVNTSTTRSIPDKISDHTSHYLRAIAAKDLDLTNCTLNSVTYLQDPDDIGTEPSFILHESNSAYSVLVSHIGGLRKYAYCFLPNHVVEDLIAYVNDLDNADAKTRLKDYFHLSSVNSLTRASLESILSKGLKPILKLYYKRIRFYLKKDEANDDDDTEASPEKLQDDYMISLNYDIYTTNKPEFVNDLGFDDFETLDKTPFFELSIHSNDSNLRAFHSCLETSIKDSMYLLNSYPTTELNKLPTKIQKIVKNNNSINLFKNFDVYQYMLSSYYNFIPADEFINNHYTRILPLNLFKNFENTELFHKELTLEDSIMKKNSNKILKSQLSLNDLQSQNERQDESVSATTPLLPKPKIKKNNSLQTLSSASISVFTSDKFRSKHDFYDEFIEHEDNESLKVFWKDAGVNSFVNNLLELKSKIVPSKTPETHHDAFDDSLNSVSYSEEEYFNAMQQYNQEHDKILAFFYFTFISICYFISGIEIGIIYSIKKIKQENQFQLSDNVWLLLVLIIGLIFSMLATIAAISLSMKRLTHTSTFHLMIIYGGFLVVIGCAVFSFIAFFT